jgi:glycosyltransferase involved in cell wall biosynthesis
MVRVLHIISGDLWAGAEAVVCQLLRNQLAIEGLSLSVVLLNDGRLAQELRQLPIPVLVLAEQHNGFFRLVHQTANRMKEHSADVVHSHRYKENLLALLAASFGRKAKLVATQHGLPEGYGAPAPLKHRLLNRLNFFFLRHAFDRVVAVSEDVQRVLVRELRINSGRVAVIHNGITVSEMVLRPRESDEFVIGSAGRLFPVKDYPLFVETASIISKAQARVRFRLAGDGPEMAALQTMVTDSGLSGKFDLLGHTEDIAGFLRGLDLYVNTSRHEGIPMSVLEAMACGLPVVAPRVGGLSEIVEHGRQGFLIEGRSPEKFAEACLRILGDQRLYRVLSSAARLRVGSVFSADQMAHHHWRLYRELAAHGVGCSHQKGLGGT